MKSLTAVAAALALLLAGCGGAGIEDQVRDGYDDYAAKHGFDKKTRNVESVDCMHEATRHYDGWCRVHPKGFHLTYDVPYKDDKVFWGESGLMKAPES